jgi:hypothetical protein
MALRVGSMWRLAAVVTAALALAVCGGGGDSGSPSVPSVPVVTPTPTPITGPTPEPSLSASCARLPAGATKYSCRTEAPTFQGDLEDAIDTVKREHPEAFDGDQVKNVGLYVVELIKALDRKGICADWDGEELAVATSHDYNDQYDVLTAKGQVRRYFVGTCYPSVIPLGRAPVGQSPAGCSLPPSREVSCGDLDAGAFYDEVSGAVDHLVKTRPDLFDFSDTNPGTDWPRVRDMVAYHQAVIDVLAPKGYCGIFDGEEIQLKRTNQFSEHYDVNYADKYIRTGSGIYRGSCYPAAF